MHELGLLRGLMKRIDSIADENQAESVTCVRVRIGALAHISGDHFREHFEQAARNTRAQDARLEVVELTDTTHPDAQEIVLDSIDVV